MSLLHQKECVDCEPLVGTATSRNVVTSFLTALFTFKWSPIGEGNKDRNRQRSMEQQLYVDGVPR